MAAHWARSLTKLYFTFTLARTERFALTGQLRFQCSQSPRRPRRTLPRALCLAGLHHPARWSRWLRSFLCQRQQRECDKAAQQQLDLPPTPVHWISRFSSNRRRERGEVSTGFSVDALRREGRWRSDRDLRLRAPGPGAGLPKKDATRGRPRAPSVWTSSRRRCGRGSSTI